VDYLRSEDIKLVEVNKYSQRKNQSGEKESGPFEVERLLKVNGAILRVKLDDRSFLSWGYKRDFVPALVNSKRVYEPIPESKGRLAAYYSEGESLLMSGNIWPESVELLPGKAYAWHQRFGKGMVICFAEDPCFRASYDGLDRMLFNAIFFASAFVD
jgi:hypothetical protein